MNSEPINSATSGSEKVRSARTGTTRWLASTRPITVVANSPASVRTVSPSR